MGEFYEWEHIEDKQTCHPLENYVNYQNETELLLSCQQNPKSEMCERLKQYGEVSKILQTILDITSTIVKIMGFVGIHEFKCQKSMELIIYAFLHFDEFIYRPGSSSRKKIRKDELLCDLRRDCNFTKQETKITYIIINYAFQAFYFKQVLTRFDESFIDDAAWFTAAKKTVNAYKLLNGVDANDINTFSRNVFCEYKNYIKRRRDRYKKLELTFECKCIIKNRLCKSQWINNICNKGLIEKKVKREFKNNDCTCGYQEKKISESDDIDIDNDIINLKKKKEHKKKKTKKVEKKDHKKKRDGGKYGDSSDTSEKYGEESDEDDRRSGMGEGGGMKTSSEGDGMETDSTGKTYSIHEPDGETDRKDGESERDGTDRKDSESERDGTDDNRESESTDRRESTQSVDEKSEGESMDRRVSTDWDSTGGKSRDDMSIRDDKSDRDGDVAGSRDGSEKKRDDTDKITGSTDSSGETDHMKERDISGESEGGKDDMVRQRSDSTVTFISTDSSEVFSIDRARIIDHDNIVDDGRDGKGGRDDMGGTDEKRQRDGKGKKDEKGGEYSKGETVDTKKGERDSRGERDGSSENDGKDESYGRGEKDGSGTDDYDESEGEGTGEGDGKGERDGKDERTKKRTSITDLMIASCEEEIQKVQQKIFNLEKELKNRGITQDNTLLDNMTTDREDFSILLKYIESGTVLNLDLTGINLPEDFITKLDNITITNDTNDLPSTYKCIMK